MREPREKPVRIAALKARLSEYIRAARRGDRVVVYDRDTPVARLVPYEAGQDSLSVRQPTRSLRDVVLAAPLPAVDSLSHLLEERQSGR